MQNLNKYMINSYTILYETVKISINNIINRHSVLNTNFSFNDYILYQNVIKNDIKIQQINYNTKDEFDNQIYLLSNVQIDVTAQNKSLYNIYLLTNNKFFL